MLMPLEGFSEQTVDGVRITGMEGIWGVEGNAMWVYRFVAEKSRKLYGMMYAPARFTPKQAFDDFKKRVVKLFKEI